MASLRLTPRTARAPGWGAAGRARQAAGLAVLAAGAALVWCNLAVRGVETQITAALTRLLLGVRTSTLGGGRDMMFFPVNAGNWAGIQITAKCTAVVFLVPLALGAGVLLYAGRLPALRVAVGAALAAVVMLAVNFARLLVLIAARVHTGVDGFDWAHVELGTWMSLAGTIGGVWVFYRVVAGGSRRDEAAAAS